MDRSNLSQHDAVEVGRFEKWLVEDEKVKQVAQALAMMPELMRAKTVEWAEYLSGDASALSVSPQE